MRLGAGVKRELYGQLSGSQIEQMNDCAHLVSNGISSWTGQPTTCRPVLTWVIERRGYTPPEQGIRAFVRKAAYSVQLSQDAGGRIEDVALHIDLSSIMTSYTYSYVPVVLQTGFLAVPKQVSC